MTEEKKKLSPTAKWFIAHLIYTAVCVGACFGAGAVQQAMRQQVAVTFQALPYAFVSFGAFVVLGILWAGEAVIAARVKKIAMLAVRLVTILALLLAGIGWAVVTMLGGDTPMWLYSSYANGNSQVLALIAGWIIVSTVKQLFKKA